MAIRDKINEIMDQIERLDFWPDYVQWVLQPQGSIFPYFAGVEKSNGQPDVKAQAYFLEGWQTFHEFNLWRHNREYGFVSSNVELPSYSCLWRTNGEKEIFRCDPGYQVAPVSDEKHLKMVYGMLRESFGVIMRLENDPKLCHKYLDDGALFSRKQLADGKWEDAPIAVVKPRPHVERVELSSDDVRVAKDLPLLKESSIELDFRMNPCYYTNNDPRPRLAYDLIGVDGGDGKQLFLNRRSVKMPDCTIADLWQTIAPCTLKEIIRLGYIPGEVKVAHERVFRLLRILTLELPFKLSLHDKLDHLKCNIAC